MIERAAGLWCCNTIVGFQVKWSSKHRRNQKKKNIWKISRIMTSSWLLADAKVLRYIATLLPQRSFIFYLRIFLIFISQFSSLEESWARTRRNLVFVQTFYRVTESTLYTFLFCFALLPPNVDVVALLRLDEGISSIKYQSSISILLFFVFFLPGPSGPSLTGNFTLT